MCCTDETGFGERFDDSLDYAAIARAYKIIWLHCVGRSDIVEMMFRRQPEESESWCEKMDDDRGNPELDKMFVAWLRDNIARPEVEFAFRMAMGEAENSAMYELEVKRKRGIDLFTEEEKLELSKKYIPVAKKISESDGISQNGREQKKRKERQSS